MLTATKLLATCRERGLTVTLKAGFPFLCGPAEEKTPSLLAALTELRDEVIKEVSHGAGQDVDAHAVE